MAMTNVYQTTPKGNVIPKEITGKVTDVKRAGTSGMGNPAYYVTLDAVSAEGADHSGTYRTMDNAGLAYGITNPEYREAEHVFTLTRAGRIRSARKAPAFYVIYDESGECHPFDTESEARNYIRESMPYDVSFRLRRA